MTRRYQPEFIAEEAADTDSAHHRFLGRRHTISRPDIAKFIYTYAIRMPKATDDRCYE